MWSTSLSFHLRFEPGPERLIVSWVQGSSALGHSNVRTYITTGIMILVVFWGTVNEFSNIVQMITAQSGIRRKPFVYDNLHVGAPIQTLWRRYVHVSQNYQQQYNKLDSKSWRPPRCTKLYLLVPHNRLLDVNIKAAGLNLAHFCR